MGKYNWPKISEMICDLYTEDSSSFSEESQYCLLRRYNPELPFSFERYLKLYKEEYKLKFVERSRVLQDIFMELAEDTRLDIINYVLYYFHKRRLNKRKLIELENYLDENR